MTYVNQSDWSNLQKICDGVEPLIITTQLPWQAHHDGTLVLGNSYNGHVFLKIMCHREPEMYCLGNARGLVPPIFLKDFIFQKSVSLVSIYTESILTSLKLFNIRARLI